MVAVFIDGGEFLQTLNFKAYLIVLGFAVGLGAESSYAYRPPTQKMSTNQGGFIDSYGRAFTEYNRKVKESGGKLNGEQRRRLYEEVFSEAKQAFNKEKENVNRRLVNISKRVNREVEKAKKGTADKSAKPGALAKDGADGAKKRTPAATLPARQITTGEIGEEATADAVKFGSAKAGEKPKTAESTVSFSVTNASPGGSAPSDKAAAKDAISDSGAETVSFGAVSVPEKK